jgi:3-hydroxyisobutyrate dehydrogenase-like beta-hydroxyacid dehydrogenase
MHNEDASSREDHPPVTVIGLGAMGRALAAAFLAGGYPTIVWNRTADKADGLVSNGATRASTVSEALAASPLAIVCVLDYATVHEILDPVAEALSGRVIVNLTNGTPKQARESAAWATELGADYVDGGIMTIPPGIGTPKAFLLYSGSERAFDAHRRQLDVLGTSTYVGADPGLASLQDLALLSGMYGMLGGAIHALALVATEGVPASQFSASLLVPWLNAMAGVIPHLAQQIDSGDYTTGVVSNLGMQAVAYANITQASKDQGIAVDLLAPLQALIDQRVADGHRDDDMSGVIELISTAAMAA